MSLADELRKVEELHRRGALTDEEFTQAKAVLLNPDAPKDRPPDPETSPAVEPDVDLTPRRVRVLQIVAGTLLLGVVGFLAVALFIVLVQGGGQGLAPPQGLPLLSLVAVVMLAAEAPLAFIVPGMMTRSALRQIVAGTWKLPPGQDATLFATAGAKLMGVRQASLIAGLALLEGAAFTGCIAYLLEAQVLALGVVGVAILLMLCQFPTEGRVRAWLERQAQALTELRLQRDVTPGL
jgi:hypothetical protein